MTVYINPPECPVFEEWVAIDIETTGLDPRLHSILSVALSDGIDTWIYLDFYGFKDIFPLLQDNNVTKVIQNALFEYQWFMHHFGIEIEEFYDTMLAEQIVREDYFLSTALDEILARRLGVFITKDTRKEFEDHPGFAIKPVTNNQIQYMVDDVLYLGEVVDSQLVEIHKKRLERTVNLEFDVVPPVAHLEYNGICFDKDLWETTVGTLEVRKHELIYEIQELVGKDMVLKVPGTHKGETIIKDVPMQEFNINSIPHVRTIFEQKYNVKTKSTSKLVLPRLAERYPKCKDFIDKLLEYRQWRDLIRVDYVSFIHPVTGRVHAHYKQTGTETGRFSSSEPNMQQVPKPVENGPNIRHVWVADSEDYVIIRVDYAQQEIRVMADVSGDEALIKAANSKDIYSAVGEYIFGHKIKKDSKERDISKAFTLATGFGAGIDRLMVASGQDREYCEQARNMIKTTFPVMARFARKMYNQVQNYGYVTTAIGRRRYFEKPIFTEAVNTPVQGTAADMFKLALVKVHKGLTELKKAGKIDVNTRVWNLVHDEIEVHCHKDEVGFVLPLVKQWMEEAGKKICPSVLHVAEAKYSYRWDK